MAHIFFKNSLKTNIKKGFLLKKILQTADDMRLKIIDFTGLFQATRTIIIYSYYAGIATL